MGAEGSIPASPLHRGGGYAAVRAHRRNSSASLSMKNPDAITIMIEQSTSPQKPKMPKLLRSQSWLYRRKNAKDEDGNITVGSYCYCDCDTYFVVVTAVLDENQYRIIDLFEQRSRISYTKGLRLITDPDVLREAQEQHKMYLRNAHERESERGSDKESERESGGEDVERENSHQDIQEYA